MAPPRKPSITPGTTLRERRAAIGKRQEDVANDAEVSQKLISELERGEQELLAVGIGRVTNIARALEWSLNELQEATGLDFAIEAEPIRYGNGAPIPPVVQHAQPMKLELPSTLERVLEQHSGLPGFPTKATIRQILPRFESGVGPETEEEWLDFILANKKWIKAKA